MSEHLALIVATGVLLALWVAVFLWMRPPDLLRLGRYEIPTTEARPWQQPYELPNGVYAVVSDLGTPTPREHAKGYRRFEVETSRPGHPGVNLRYFPRRYLARAYLREQARK